MLIGSAALTLAPAAALHADARLSVVATTQMIADTAAIVGGPLVTVHGLFGPGVDPHVAQPNGSWLAEMKWADVILWHGLGLEGELAAALAGFSERKPVVAVAESVPEDRLIAGDPASRGVDPHIWTDPRLWQFVVSRIRDTLVDALPGHAAAIATNAANYAEEVAALARYSEDVLQSVPPDLRVLVTPHDGFNYLGRAYGFEAHGLSGVLNDGEVAPQHVEEILDTLVARQVPAVFAETTGTDLGLLALKARAAARGQALAIGGTLYGDALGEADTYEGTVLGAMDHNVTTIARALGGKSPARGRVGALSAAG